MLGDRERGHCLLEALNPNNHGVAASVADKPSDSRPNTVPLKNATGRACNGGVLILAIAHLYFGFCHLEQVSKPNAICTDGLGLFIRQRAGVREQVLTVFPVPMLNANQ